MRRSQFADEYLVTIRFCAPQFVIEMNDGKNNPDLLPKLKHDPQQRNRVRPARNRNPHTVSGTKQTMFSGISERRWRQLVHCLMLPPSLYGSLCGSGARGVGHSCPTPLILI